MSFEFMTHNTNSSSGSLLTRRNFLKLGAGAISIFAASRIIKTCSEQRPYFEPIGKSKIIPNAIANHFESRSYLKYAHGKGTRWAQAVFEKHWADISSDVGAIEFIRGKNKGPSAKVPEEDIILIVALSYLNFERHGIPARLMLGLASAESNYHRGASSGMDMGAFQVNPVSLRDANDKYWADSINSAMNRWGLEEYSPDLGKLTINGKKTRLESIFGKPEYITALKSLSSIEISSFILILKMLQQGIKTHPSKVGMQKFRPAIEAYNGDPDAVANNAASGKRDAVYKKAYNSEYSRLAKTLPKSKKARLAAMPRIRKKAESFAIQKSKQAYRTERNRVLPIAKKRASDYANTVIGEWARIEAYAKGKIASQ